MKKGSYKPKKPKKPTTKLHFEPFRIRRKDHTTDFKTLANAVKKFAKKMQTNESEIQVRVVYSSVSLVYEKKPTDEEMNDYNVKLQKYHEAMQNFELEKAKKAAEQYRLQAAAQLKDLDKTIETLARKVKLHGKK